MNDENPTPATPTLNRQQFLFSLFMTEAVLLLLAPVITRLASGAWFPHGFVFTAENLLLGVLAALPVVVMILLLSFGPVAAIPLIERAMSRITGRLRSLLGRTIAELGAFDIVSVSVVAGIAEELFFRGMLQSYIGLLGAALVFGLLHALTPAYFVLATIIGLYFGYLYVLSDNLLIPIVAHGMYDIFAVYLLAWQFRKPLRAQEQRQL